MKRRLKTLLIICACALCAFAVCFSGCGKRDAEYISESFKYNVEPKYDKWFNCSYSFDVKIYERGRYELSFDITAVAATGGSVMYGDAVKFTYNFEKNETFTKSGFFNVERESGSTSTSEDIKIVISNVTVRRLDNKDDSEYKSYAIGFGVSSAVILAGLIAFFIADKTVISKRKGRTE